MLQQLFSALTAHGLIEMTKRYILGLIGPAGHQTYRAIVLINPTTTTATTTTTTTAILPNSIQLNAPNSAIFQARSSRFCM